MLVIISNSVIIVLQITFHIQCTEVFIFYFHTKVHMPSTIRSLFLTIPNFPWSSCSMFYKNVTINEVPCFKIVNYYTLFQDLRERTDIKEYY